MEEKKNEKSCNISKPSYFISYIQNLNSAHEPSETLQGERSITRKQTGLTVDYKKNISNKNLPKGIVFLNKAW